MFSITSLVVPFLTFSCFLFIYLFFMTNLLINYCLNFLCTDWKSHLIIAFLRLMIVDLLWSYSKFQVKESKWLVKCFLNYLRQDKSEVNVLFDMLSIFLVHTRIDYTFLKEFYIIEVCKSLMLMHENWVLILSLTIAFFHHWEGSCVWWFSLSMVSGCWRLWSKYEKNTSLAFFATFSI